MGKQRSVFQFKIELLDVEPNVWRRIQVSDLYSFWDLHVAITDAMGWEDYHLHQFETRDPKTGHRILITIPDDQFGHPEDVIVLPNYDTKIRDFFSKVKQNMIYIYDFGDNWVHKITFEGIFDKQEGTKYPTCLEGQYACPPEDVGGAGGYFYFLEAITNPEHEDYESMIEWVGGSFDPKQFDPKKVKFDSPRKRFEEIFTFE